MKQSEVTTKALFPTIPDSMKKLFANSEYPWDILTYIGEYIENNYNEFLEQGYTEYKPGILVGKGTVIAESAFIEAPTVIGPNCEIRHCAYIRGKVITGEGCVIGNSTEVKNSVLFDYVQIPHFNYVGDAILGNRSHLGAGAICSNVRQDKSAIIVKTEQQIVTNRRKLGAIICDDVEVGCGAVINPGSIICHSCRIYPLTSVRGVIKENCIVKTTANIVPMK